MNTSFLIGSPRSGTTILSQILDLHPDIAQWYEPYFIWNFHLATKTTDIHESCEVTPQIRKFILKEFSIFRNKSQKKIVLDKSPEHSFHIPFNNEIFPEAKWIHLLRDGRDVVLSIHKEWHKRARIVQQKDFAAFFNLAFQMLSRQPFIRYKWKALYFELKKTKTLNPKRMLNKSKWQGKPGWGPRFQGWRDVLGNSTILEFNCYQWLQSINKIYEDITILPGKNILEIRYENLITNPRSTLAKIFQFLELEMPENFNEKIPTLKSDNFNKWQNEFTPAQKMEISPILTEKLIELGFEKNRHWAYVDSNSGKIKKID